MSTGAPNFSPAVGKGGQTIGTRHSLNTYQCIEDSPSGNIETITTNTNKMHKLNNNRITEVVYPTS